MSALLFRGIAARVGVRGAHVMTNAAQMSLPNLPRYMKALVSVKPNVIEIAEKPVPEPGYGEAVIKMTTTTICGTDTHIFNGEYPVKSGLTVGHEPVGILAKIGPGVTGYHVGQRVLCGAITPCGQCNGCLSNDGSVGSQCGTAHPSHHGWSHAMGGWKLGNTIDGSQAEYMLVPAAQANLTAIPEGLTDDEVLMCPDIMSTGFSGAEGGKIKIGDTVAVVAQGPIGLCATAGARLMGATKIFVVSDMGKEKWKISKSLGADIQVPYRKSDAIKFIADATDGRMCDCAIEALGTQRTFETALRLVRPGGILSSLGVYSTDLKIPYNAYAAGLGNVAIVNQLCPGGKERMRRLLSVVASRRVDLRPLVTHHFKFDQILEAYDTFVNKKDNCMKVSIRFD